MHHIILWKWHQPFARETYTALHVNVMVRMLRRNLDGITHRIVCVTDDPSGVTECETFMLWRDHDNLANATKHTLPSCYRRLKLFDPVTQTQMGMFPGDRIVSLDLDTLVVGQLQPLLGRDDYRFLGWALPGTHHPKVFNGSFFMFTAGELAEVWREFNAKTSPQEAFQAGYLGSDQSWLSYKLVNKARCDGFTFPEIASYPHHVRKMKVLDARTRLIFFHGKRKPWHTDSNRESPWIARYWR